MSNRPRVSSRCRLPASPAGIAVLAWMGLVAGLAGLVAPALAQGPAAVPVLPDEAQSTAAALRDGALQGSGAYDLVKSLTTEVGPRSAGSRGDAAAVAWALRTLKGLGFSNVRAEMVKVPHWERGAESGEITAPYPQQVALAALGGSSGTTQGGIESEVVEAASLDALAGLGAAKVKGKIVFFNTPTERTREGSGYQSAVVVRSSGPARAGRLGAVAVLVRSIGTDGNRLPHTGATRYEAGGPRVPAAALSGPDADLLAAELATGKSVRFRLRLGARTLADAQSANVIGEIPGRERPEEIVLLGCHLDSWDLGTGALDDGAGCAIVIESARRIGQLPAKPRRTLRVVLFANEEFGLSGAEAYAASHAKELPRHVVAAEADLGSGRVWRLDTRVAPEALAWVRELNRLVAPLRVNSGGNEAEGGADLIPLGPAGVPVLSPVQDATAYFDFHHTANDTLDKVNARDLDYNVAAWSALAYAAAEMPGDFGRVVTAKPPGF